MTDFNSDLMAQMREDFLAESQEILERLGPLLTRLEKEQTPELVNTIFRELHTLKGTAGFVGIDPIHRLAHKMEDVFGEVRAERLKINPVLIDAAFAGVQTIAAMRENVLQGGTGVVDSSAVIARFTAIQRGEVSEDKPTPPPQPPSPSQPLSPPPTLPPTNSPAANQYGERAPAHNTGNTGRITDAGTSAEPTVPTPTTPRPSDSNSEPEMSLADLRRALELELKGKAKPQPVIAPIVPEPIMPAPIQPEPAPVLHRMPIIPAPALSVPIIPEAIPVNLPEPLPKSILGPVEPAETMPANLIATPYNAVHDAQLESALLSATRSEMINKSLPDAMTQVISSHPANLLVNNEIVEPTPTASYNTVQVNRSSTGGWATLDLANVAGGGTRPAPTRGETTIRVDIETLDSLMLLVGELITARNTLIARAEILRDEPLIGCSAAIGRLTRQLQNAVTNVRLVPVERLFNRFTAVVRNLARERDMQVHLEIEGGDTPLDRTVLEQMSDPFVHLLRNAIDHGLEPLAVRQQLGKPERGLIRLSAERRGDDVTLKIQDDGRGIDPTRIRTIAVQRGICSEEDVMVLSDEQALRLIFAPGFSTAATITDISGRGVGMDVVLQNVRRLRGNIEIDTRVGEGTTFIIKLPLTLAILQVLLVRVGEYTYSIPLHAVRETLLLMPDSIQILQQREVAFIRNVAVPVRYLKDLLDQNGNGVLNHGMTPAVIVRLSHGDEILVVDELVGKQQVVIKPLGQYLGTVKGVEGSAILPDGSVSLILDVEGLSS